MLDFLSAQTPTRPGPNVIVGFVQNKTPQGQSTYVLLAKARTIGTKGSETAAFKKASVMNVRTKELGTH